MRKNIKKFKVVQFLLLLCMIFPALTFAVTAPTNFSELVKIAVDLITAVLPVIMLLALFYFFWGLAQYLKKDEANKDESKHIMLSGVIGLFVMVSVWGFVSLLSDTLGTDIETPDLGDINLTPGNDLVWEE